MAEKKRQSQMINFVIDPVLLKKLDDYRFEHRFTSRAAAIKHLIDQALDADEADPPAENAGPPPDAAR